MEIDACYCDTFSEFVVSERRKARKEHRCSECAGKIDPGTVYEHNRGKCEGEMWSSNTCAGCLSIRDYIKANVPCFCWEYHNMLQSAKSCAEDVRMSGELPGFYFGFLRLIVKAWRPYMDGC